MNTNIKCNTLVVELEPALYLSMWACWEIVADFPKMFFYALKSEMIFP